MRRMTAAFAVVIGLAGARTLAAQSEAPDSAVVAVEDSTADSMATDTPAVARQPEPEHPRHAKGEEGHGEHKHRHHHGEGDGVRMRGGETRIPRHSGGGEAARPATGGSDKPKPNR